MENCPVNGFSREGLSTIEVNQKRLIFGYNEAKQKRELFFVRLANKFMGITPWLLEVTAAIAVILGNYTGAALVVVLLVTNAIIAFVQEKRY
jgi:H+-transporting ATPase